MIVLVTVNVAIMGFIVNANAIVSTNVIIVNADFDDAVTTIVTFSELMIVTIIDTA